MPPLRPGTGHLSTLRVAQESTIGVAPGTATELFEVENFNWTPNPSVIQDTNMHSGGRFARAYERGLKFVTGSFNIRVGFEGFERFWKWLLPTYTSAVVDTSGRDHTLKDGTTPIALTLDQSFGNVPTGKVHRFLGSKLTGFRGLIAIGQHLSAQVSFAAISCTPNTTPMAGSPAVTNKVQIVPRFLVTTVGSLKDGSGQTATEIALRRLELDVQIPHNTQRGYMGSEWADEPLPNGPIVASLGIQAEYNAIALLDAITAGTHTDLKFLFQHPTVIGAATAKRELEITAKNVQPDEARQDIEGYGEILQNARYVLAHHESDASGLVIRTRNALAALT